MKNQETVTNESAATPATSPELSINDLQNLRIIVDAAVRRGAFGASEVASVGATYDRLDTFLTAVTPTVATESDAVESEPAAA